MGLEQVVVKLETQRTKDATDSPVIVKSDQTSKTLDNVVATNLSEGLRFPTGLRWNRLPTCKINTQLRINDFKGVFTQNIDQRRPIFSPPYPGLNNGMEQNPTT